MLIINWLTNWWGKSLRRRLLVSSLVTLLFFLTLLGFLSFRIGQIGMRYEVNQRNAQLATLVAKEIDIHFDNILANVRLFTYQSEASTDVLSIQARAMLELRCASPLTYRALYLLDSKGHVLIHLAEPLEELLAIGDVTEIIERSPIPLTDEISTAYEATKSGELFLSPTHIVGSDQVPIIYMGIPIMTEQGRLSQIVVAEIDLRDIWRRVDEIRVGQTGQAFVVSQEGTIIAHPDRAYIGQPLVPELRQVLAGYEGQTEYTDPISGRSMLASYSPVGRKTGWGIVVEQEQTEAFTSVNMIAFVTAGVLLAAIGMAIIVSILIVRSITRPIQYLAETTRTIARTGNLSQDIVVKGQDEVSQLAATFNQMMVSLRKSRDELQQWGEDLERRVQERTVDLEQRGQELANTNVSLEEASRHKSEFLASMSHELRTPLNSIIGYTKLILDGLEGDINEEQKRDLQTVHRNGTLLLELINGLLDLSRIEAGKTVLSYGTFIISDLLSEVIPSVEQLAREKGLTLTYSVAPDLDNLYADKAKTKQVLINLLGNAIKFTNEGSVKLNVAETDGDFIFSVTDTGIGMEEGNLEAIFDSFKQVGETAQIAGYEGTGLGLAISKQFIEMQGGRIWAESELGKGSTFTFTLPKKRVASP